MVVTATPVTLKATELTSWHVAECKKRGLDMTTKTNDIIVQDYEQCAEMHNNGIINYEDVLSKNLKIMDGSAVALARDNNIPIVVFPINKQNSFLNVILNKGNFTIIKE